MWPFHRARLGEIIAEALPSIRPEAIWLTRHVLRATDSGQRIRIA
jgi:hypothetical protein